MSQRKRRGLRHIHAFQHTHIGVYMVASFALLVIFTESTQGICERYHINKKWFYLYGVLCFFAYLYARPFIRAGLGSASRGYVNVYALYILWLCSAVFYHLPSLSALGFDIRADVSFGISVFFGSLLVLVILHVMHAVAAGLGWISPSLAPPGTRLQQIGATMLLNSGAVAAACSLYFGFCGNGAPPGPDHHVKHAVCSKWLHPILRTEYPKFSSLMLYGEGVMKNETVIGIDFPLDGLGITLIPAGQVISPVFTLWITLLLLYLVNACADHLAAEHMAVRSVSELRPQMSEPNLRELLKTFAEATSPRKTRSMELPKGSRMRRHSAGNTVVEKLVEGTHRLGVWGAAALEQGAAFVEQHQHQLKVLKHLKLDLGVEEEGPQPHFLPMVPWWSGTSADLFKTLFDLMVSVKLFLGRFDMRTMQAATAASMADSFNDRPAEGDGFTYEHCVNRQELWLDFVADTGDGGNPTYTVARALAAPRLRAEVTAHVPYTGPQLDDEPVSPSTSKANPKRVDLPRAELLLIGGDLAYPNPSKETYEQRLFTPFQDAMPPPPHYHPGRLVVHKPDLPPAYGVRDTFSRSGIHGLSPRSSRRASAAALRDYSGPMAFAIPGNHDWIDGLETFIKQIQHKGWLGGWLLPQEKSYFSLRLPHGWWLFGFDLALVMDIDMCQYRYFANVVEQRMAPDDQVIIMTHEPIWLLDWYWQGSTTTNLRQLVRGHLRGRARLHLAGDLHFYMRHTFQPRPCCPPAPPAPPQSNASATKKIRRTSSLTSSLSTPFYPFSRTPLTTDDSGKLGSRRGSDEAGGSPAVRDSNHPAHSVHESHGVNTTHAVSTAHGASIAQSVNTAHSVNTARCVDAARSVGSRAKEDVGPGRGHFEVRVTRTSSDTFLSPPAPSSDPFDLPYPPTIPGNQPHHSTPTTTLPTPAMSGRLPDNRADHNSVEGDSFRGDSSYGELGGVSDDAISSLSSSLSSTPDNTPRLMPRPKNLPEINIPPSHLVDFPSSSGRSPVPSLTIKTERTSDDIGVAQRCSVCRKRLSQPHLYDPEHLVVNGLGGAFLHPTHPFKDARFTSMPDDAAEATAAIYSVSHQPCACLPSPLAPLSGRWYYGPGTVDVSEADQTAINGEYTCQSAYPPPEKTHQLGGQNLHVFRLKNSRFDVIGGMAYFLLAVSTLPRCTSIPAILDADSFHAASIAFIAAYFDAVRSILLESYISLTVLVLLFVVLFFLARAGGVGAASTVPPRPRRTVPSPEPSVENQLRGARFGGMPMQLLFACSHTLAHLNVAVTLMMLLELGVVTLIRYGSLGKDGMHSLYDWFALYEQQHFPDPKGLREGLKTWTWGLYPALLKHAMTAFDIPEVIASVRQQMCSISTNSNISTAALTRGQSVGFYMGMLAYYWVLATPAMGLVFGIYLYISVCFCHVHYDEAFSALRIPSYKGFSRMHITQEGDLELFTLATSKVPSAWRLDPRWSGVHGGGSKKVVGHKARYPSKWLPAEAEDYDTEDDQLSPSRTRSDARGTQDVQFKVVDYVKIPKQRNWDCENSKTA